MARRVFNVLFVCSGNSARSIIAEAYLNGLKLPHLRAFSAGAAPLGSVHPLALRVLSEAGIPAVGLRSKSWDEFAKRDAPKMDMVINLCEDPDKEPCPAWPGKPAMAHWAVPDPVTVPGTEARKLAAFEHVLAYIKRRTDYLLLFDDEQLANLAAHVSKGPARADGVGNVTSAHAKKRR